MNERAGSPAAAGDPAYRKLQRTVLAVSVLLAPLSLAVWFSVCPPFGDVSCPSQGVATIAAFRAMNPLLHQVFTALSMVAPYAYPVSYIGLGLIAMRGSPWLATLGTAAGFAGSIPWAWITAGQAGLTQTFAGLAPSHLFVVIEHQLTANPVVLFFATAWVLGHLLGYLLLGIALARAHTVPRWAAWSITASALLMGPIAYGTGLGALQVAGYGLVLAGSIPAARAILGWTPVRQLPPRARRTGPPGPD